MTGRAVTQTGKRSTLSKEMLTNAKIGKFLTERGQQPRKPLESAAKVSLKMMLVKPTTLRQVVGVATLSN